MANFPEEYIRSIRTYIEDTTLKTAFSDSFDDAPIRWKIWGNGSGYGATQDTTKALSGTHSLKLITQSSTPAINDYVAITGFFPLPVVPTQCELRGSFYTPDDPATINLDFTLVAYSQASAFKSPNYILVWRGALSKWQYHNSAGAFSDSGNTMFNWASGETYWNDFALKTLPQEGEYLELRNNDQVQSLANISPALTAIGTNSLIKVQVFLQALNADIKEVFLDNISVVAT